MGEEAHHLVWETLEGKKFRLAVVAPQEQLDLNRDGRVDAAELRASVEELVESEIPVAKIFLGAEQTEISEAEAIAKGEALANHRRQQLLKKYPQADLDGDGQIDAEEAKALAAKLQATKAGLESNKRPNQ